MSKPVPADLPPAPAEDAPPLSSRCSRAASSLAIRPEAALALATETLTLATREMEAKWERERESPFRPARGAPGTRPRSSVPSSSGGRSGQSGHQRSVLRRCGAPTTMGRLLLSQVRRNARGGGQRTHGHGASADVDEKIDRESAALETPARAEIHAVEVQALQRWPAPR